MIPVNFVCNTAGTGYCSDISAPVRIIGIDLVYVSDDGAFGELVVYFDQDDWDITVDGLIYTDPHFKQELIDNLILLGYDATDIGYSEQGMQSDIYVSFDVEQDFIDSYIE